MKCIDFALVCGISGTRSVTVDRSGIVVVEPMGDAPAHHHLRERISGDLCFLVKIAYD